MYAPKHSSVQAFTVAVAALLLFVGCEDNDGPKASVLPVPILQKTPFTYRGEIKRAWGGDNFEVIAKNKVHFAWIAGISTPAYGQFGHQLALDRLKELTEKRQVEISVLQRDPWKREICELKILSDKGQTDLATTLLKEGLAWSNANASFGSKQKLYVELENEAKKNKLGIWSQPNPIPPWIFWKQQNNELKKKLAPKE